MSLLDQSETFSSLAEKVGLDVRLRKAVQRLGHVRPTLVQSRCLPLAVSSGRDLLVRAKTGSGELYLVLFLGLKFRLFWHSFPNRRHLACLTGKTLAYCLPLLQKILALKHDEDSCDMSAVRAVVLVPTRDLCTQVYRTLQSLMYYCDDVLSSAALTASRGKSEKSHQEFARQQAMLRDRPDVIVATPAGLLTHIRNGDIHLKDSVETLVVDEADLVLSFGKWA